MPKKKTPGQLKKDLWKIFSQFIRLRDSDEFGMVKCCTCDTRKPWKYMQAGHFIPKAKGNAIYFHEDNVHGQCQQCNVFKKGNLIEYYPWMLKKYGEVYVNELRALAKTERKYKSYEYEELIEHYKQLVAELKNG